MESKLINKYIPIINNLSLKYQYNNNIKHLLYLIVPALIERYGYRQERLIQEVLFSTTIIIKEDKNSKEEAYYTSIPIQKEIEITTNKWIVLKKYQENNEIQLLDNLVHELNHAINSYQKEIQKEKDKISLRTGLTKVIYTYPELKPIKKENTYLLEEILNTIQTEEIINIILNHQEQENLEIANAIKAIRQEVKTNYKSKSYYLETTLFTHILKNRTFTSTLNNLRLSGNIEDIESWFDNITGIPNSYTNLNNNLVNIMSLETELMQKKYFKKITIFKIQKLLEKSFLIIDTFNQNCHYK